ncbi:MAG: hypothetical protein AUH85_12470 [Chloroflexi bacterium 13_1_40CM_4_68_4]|nr:MAG: hypothetical protein AUH85_12470 [Chloroflexi bacterium 13_1_40CM_4_68_4]
MSVEICAVVDRVPADLAPARAVGTGPYVVVIDASSDDALEERLASRLALFGALRTVACLPFRLGSVVADDEAALLWLVERREVIEQALARAAARVEFDLHLSTTSDGDAHATEAEGPGTRHLRSLAANYARLSADQSRRALDACRDLPAVDETAVVAEDGFIAFLVADASAFARATSTVRLDGARWSGPWPAFTFAARWLEVT